MYNIYIITNKQEKKVLFMGSRVMHAIIALKVAEVLQIENKTEFLLGGIAADATSDKEASHFYTGAQEDYTRSIDYEFFFEKYKTRVDRDYILGYYTHLIADEIWLTGFYLPWLKNRMEVEPEIHTLYHQDFRLLNGKLAHYYGVKEVLTNAFEQQVELLDLDEVKGINTWKLAQYVIEDFNDMEQSLEQPLHVFTFDQIVGYIETSIQKSVYKTKHKLSNI